MANGNRDSSIQKTLSRLHLHSQLAATAYTGSRLCTYILQHFAHKNGAVKNWSPGHILRQLALDADGAKSSNHIAHTNGADGDWDPGQVLCHVALRVDEAKASQHVAHKNGAVGDWDPRQIVRHLALSPEDAEDSPFAIPPLLNQKQIPPS
jgi:hypothetical protein